MHKILARRNHLARRKSRPQPDHGSRSRRSLGHRLGLLARLVPLRFSAAERTDSGHNCACLIASPDRPILRDMASPSRNSGSWRRRAMRYAN